MTYLLDTNTCIQYLNGRSQRVKERIQSTKPEQVTLCSVVKAELFYGALRARNPQRTIALLEAFFTPFRSLPFDDRSAETYGRIRARLTDLGTPIGPNDLLIAATAVTHGAVLVTHNTREFGRVEGLAWEDWETGTRHWP